MILQGKILVGFSIALFSLTCTSTQIFACTTPAGLSTSSISSTGATLNWGSVSGALSYKAHYHVYGSSSWTNVTVTPNAAVLTGLTGGTLYEWKVLTNCSGSTSSYSSLLTFSTLCAVPSALSTTSISDVSATLNWGSTSCDSFLLRYFVTSLPGNIAYKIIKPGTATNTTITGLVSSTNYSWLIRTYCSGGQSGTYSNTLIFTTASGPCLPPSGLSASSITTTSATLNWGAGGGASYNIRYRITGTTSWTSTTSTTTTKSISGLTAGSLYEFQLQTVCGSGNSSWSASSTFYTSCSLISGLSTTNITSSSAKLNWNTVSCDSFLLRYFVTSLPNAISYKIITPGTAASTTLNGLSSNTNYSWLIRTYCNGGQSGSYSSTLAFNTGSTSCSTPTGLTSSSVTTTGATLLWTAGTGAMSYNIQYRIVGTGSWTSSTSTSTSKSISGLTSGTNYEFQIQTVCGGGSSSWSSSSTFTTQVPTCSTPTGLSSTSITSSGATLNWTAVNGAVSYNIQYRIVGAGSWTSTTSTSTSKSVSSLTAATNYEFQVQTACSGNSSSWSSSFTFTTSGTTSIPIPDHIVILVEENHGYSQIIGSSSAPYINALASDGMSASFTQMYAIEHPSQPDYLDFFSGSNQGITNDNLPSSHFTTPNLARELINAGKTFITFSQTLPSVGSDAFSSGKYVRKHNPLANWMGTGTNQVSSTLNQPFTAFPTNYTTLPTVSYVVPDMDYDMHDGTISAGDTWFHNNLDGYVQWAKTHNSLFILIFDEDNGSYSNRIVTIFTGQMVKSGQVSTTYNFYNLLRTIEDMYGTSHAGNAASASAMHGSWLNGYRESENIHAGELQWNIFPNPSNDVINVEYTLEENSTSSFIIYNSLGQKIENQILTQSGKGFHNISFSATELRMSKGVYFLEMTVDDKKYLKKIVVIE